MPVMRRLHVGGTTYDTVGEASVTQVQTSGTKIATVSIDGTATDIYAPAGGSSVDPATATPNMDGTAAVGSSAKYAREDHVHPTDTSRAASVHTHAIGDVTSLQSALDGKAASDHTHTPASIGAAAATHGHAISDVTSLQSALDGKQATLVSGTNIKTIDGVSLLGSGNLNISIETTAYRVRPGSNSKYASDTGGRNRIWLTSADGQYIVPISTGTSTSVTETKVLNTRPIDPFGPIEYSSSTSSTLANAYIESGYHWQQYNSVDIRYSYIITLSQRYPVYLKCTPQTNGGAVMAGIVQQLPSSNDGYIYILLGVAANSTNLDLQLTHPVYYHDGTGIRLWTGVTSASGVSF